MKEFKTYDEQIQLLKSRGLIINDEEWAKTKLKEENYYNIINGYKDVFLDKSKTTETFKRGVTFEEIYYLYDFDRVLRNILFKPLMKVENTLRSLIAYTFSEMHGCDNYLKCSNFENLSNNFGTSPEKIEERAKSIQFLIANLQNDISTNISKKDYIHHYIMKYSFVPLWVLVNAITLGRLSQFYNLMNQDERIKVAMNWNVAENDLKIYMKILAHYRNLCAHDDRVYNSSTGGINISDTNYHSLLNIPKINGRYKNGKNDLFALIIIFKIMLPKDDFNSLCNKIDGRRISLCKKITNINIVDIFEQMGLPPGWLKIKES